MWFAADGSCHIDQRSPSRRRAGVEISSVSWPDGIAVDVDADVKDPNHISATWMALWHTVWLLSINRGRSNVSMVAKLSPLNQLYRLLLLDNLNHFFSFDDDDDEPTLQRDEMLHIPTRWTEPWPRSLQQKSSFISSSLMLQKMWRRRREQTDKKRPCCGCCWYCCWWYCCYCYCCCEIRQWCRTYCRANLCPPETSGDEKVRYGMIPLGWFIAWLCRTRNILQTRSTDRLLYHHNNDSDINIRLLDY